MTDFSLQLRLLPDGMPVSELKRGIADLPVLRSFPRLAREVGPYRLVEWALDMGLEVYYVDNCWVRAIADAATIRTFLMELSDSDFVDLSDPPTGLLIIEAEEF